jgi:hypothetical protein
MALETELKTYTDKLTELLPNEGKFVLIHGSEVVGLYVAYEDALNIGYERFKLEPFLVKRIQATETVQFITRGSPCLTSLGK